MKSRKKKARIHKRRMGIGVGKKFFAFFANSNHSNKNAEAAAIKKKRIFSQSGVFPNAPLKV